MATKKKGKKARKKSKERFKNASANQLIRMAQEKLANGNARDSISILKTAEKKKDSTEDVSILFFRAYSLRESQLREKGMVRESEAVKDLAIHYMPDTGALSQDDMVTYLSFCTDKEAVEAYVGYCAVNPSSIHIESNLANKIFMNDGWEFIEQLDPNNRLRTDAVHVIKASEKMDQGDWEDALGFLKPISRRSPFAQVRLFCRAMVLFYKEDDKELNRLLPLISDEFPLTPVIKALQKSDGDRPVISTAVNKLLWEGIVDERKLIKEIIRDIKNYQLKRVESHISTLAGAIYPEEPFTAISSIIQTLAAMDRHGQPYSHVLYRMVFNLLPQTMARLVSVKIAIISFMAPFEAIKAYLPLIEEEFHDPEQRKMARARLLQYVPRTLWQKGLHIYDIELDGLMELCEQLGLKTDRPELAMIHLMREGLRLDPYDREGYELLIEMARDRRYAYKILINALDFMAKQFPDDPYPCLELADLYQKKNAYRKAEKALEEALKRSPHDDRALDRHAVYLLISVEQNIKKGRYHLCESDFEKAEKLNRKPVNPVIKVKRLIYDVLRDQSGAEDRISKAISHLSLFDQLRMLALFIFDLTAKRPSVEVKALKIAKKELRKRLKKRIKELSSSEIIRLLMPVERSLKPLFNGRNIVEVFQGYLRDLMVRVDDSEIIMLFDIILGLDKYEMYGLVKKEIGKRLRKDKIDQDTLLRFYLITIEHLTGEKDDPDIFLDLISGANEPQKRQLQDASRRLSQYAEGVLKDALQKFDFNLLKSRFLFDPFGEYDSEIPYMDDESFDDPAALFDDRFPGFLDPEDAGIDLTEIIRTLEDMVDELDLRGAPKRLIRDLAADFHSSPKARKEIDLMKKYFTGEIKDLLSPEARILFFTDETVRKPKKEIPRSIQMEFDF